jgi:ATP-dependent DNA ligase
LAKRQGIMLAYPFDEKRLAKWGTYHLQPKLNGVRFRAIIEDNKATLYSSSGDIINSVPHINDELEELLKDSLYTELDGELYKHGMSLQQIQSIVRRTVNRHPDFMKIEAHVFDVINNSFQCKRLLELVYIIPKREGYIIRVPFHTITRVNTYKELLNSYINQGYEGIILRNEVGFYSRKRSTDMMKVKPMNEDTYMIIGSEEEVSIHGEPKNALGSFICVSDGEPFKVGTGLTRQQRIDYWNGRDKLYGKWLRVKYLNLSDERKVPIIPVVLEVL